MQVTRDLLLEQLRNSFITAASSIADMYRYQQNSERLFYVKGQLDLIEEMFNIFNQELQRSVESFMQQRKQSLNLELQQLGKKIEDLVHHDEIFLEKQHSFNDNNNNLQLSFTCNDKMDNQQQNFDPIQQQFYEYQQNLAPRQYEDQFQADNYKQIKM